MHRGRLGSWAEQPHGLRQRRHRGSSGEGPSSCSPHKPRCSVGFLGRAVPIVSPGRADPVMEVQRDSLCRPGQTLVFHQRVLQGGSLVATKELFLKSKCAVNLSHSQLELCVLGKPTATGTGTAWMQETWQLLKPLDTQHHISLQDLCV